MGNPGLQASLPCEAACLLLFLLAKCAPVKYALPPHTSNQHQQAIAIQISVTSPSKRLKNGSPFLGLYLAHQSFNIRPIRRRGHPPSHRSLLAVLPPRPAAIVRSNSPQGTCSIGKLATTEEVPSDGRPLSMALRSFFLPPSALHKIVRCPAPLPGSLF